MLPLPTLSDLWGTMTNFVTNVIGTEGVVIISLSIAVPLLFFVLTYIMDLFEDREREKSLHRVFTKEELQAMKELEDQLK